MKTVGYLAAALLAAGGVAAGYWAGSHSQAAVNAPVAAPAAAERKPLYYRNPMGLPDTSPVPKKDAMGMDYLPVYAEAEGNAPGKEGQIRISTEKIQKLGVRVEATELRSLERVVRAVGRIEPDEKRLYTIAPKFEGYVERLLVNTTGQQVSKGQVLFEAYSPELVSAQREYAIAAEGMQTLQGAGAEAQSGMKQLAEASLARLRNWDISEDQLKSLVGSGVARRTLSFRSPASGIVTEKKALAGMRFMPGEALYQIADLSAVWAIADVFEQDIAQVKLGARARIRINAYPGREFVGRIAYIYPTLKAETRTVSVRVELPNPGGLLKPAMFAQMELPVGGAEKRLTVPDSAVIDSGTRRIVLLQREEGRFEPREVKTGARGDTYVEILEGLAPGDKVVVAANFLIDAESNLQAVVGGMGGSTAAASTAPATVGHSAEGKVESVDAKEGSVSVSHGPVATLKWPAMTMDFRLANAGMLKDLKPGSVIGFEFVERGQGTWVITRIKPAAARPGR